MDEIMAVGFNGSLIWAKPGTPMTPLGDSKGGYFGVTADAEIVDMERREFIDWLMEAIQWKGDADNDNQEGTDQGAG